MNYPSPCDKCQYKTCSGMNCQPFQMYIRSWWRYFNGIYQRLHSGHKGISVKFVYLHPDEYRRYITVSPCENCGAKDKCVHPCATYWIWWDEHMEWHRRRLKR